MQDVLNDLNKKYNKNYKIKLTSGETVANTNWTDIDKIGKILIGVEFLNDLKADLKKNFNLDKVIVNGIFIILHEYKHLLQMNDLFNDDNPNNNKYIKEFFLLGVYRNFYDYYHDYFMIEKEANEFGYNNIFEYLHKYTNFSKFDVEVFIADRYNIYLNENKKFLKLYKLLIKYFELNNKIKIKRVDNFYNELYKIKENIKKLT